MHSLHFLSGYQDSNLGPSCSQSRRDNRTTLYPENQIVITRAFKKSECIAFASFKSGYQDSNLGPPAPKAGAITGLRYTPKTHKRTAIQSGEFAERGGFEPPVP